MYQYTSLETDFTKQKPILEIDFLLDSGATLNLLNEYTWNELKYKNPHHQLTKSVRTLTVASNTKIETWGTINLNVTPERISNSRSNPHPNFNIFFYVTQCNHNVLGTPFFNEYIETINVNTNNLTINTPTDIDNEIRFFQNTTKEYPYYSRIYPVYNKETQYFEPHEHNCLTFPIGIFKRMEKSNGKILHGSLHYFEPINKYHNLSVTDIKDLTKENENFADIYLINKNNHKKILKNELIGFIYQNTPFKTFHMEVYRTNLLYLFSALYHLTYEKENDINDILQRRKYRPGCNIRKKTQFQM